MNFDEYKAYCQKQISFIDDPFYVDSLAMANRIEVVEISNEILREINNSLNFWKITALVESLVIGAFLYYLVKSWLI